MINHLKEAANLVERGFDKNIRICVTGLSGAGKTAFITSFINQMLQQKNSKQLPFWLAHAEQRILGAKLIPYEQLHVPEFPYRQAIDSLYQQQQWPQSTKTITQARLSIRYKVKNKWLRKLKYKTSHLDIDIVDYPGEWLLDLPMLDMNYEQWSSGYFDWLQQEPQKSLAQDWLAKLKSFSEQSKQTDSELKSVSQSFHQFLIACKNHPKSISFIQPGRFVLPGDLAGAPVLDFFPMNNIDASNEKYYQQLRQRFDYYRDQVVKPFFKEYFSKVDRQVLLVDCLQILNAGYSSYRDLQETLTNLIYSFNYGQSNWFKRMFKPSINKLIIAASKADHVPPDQHQALDNFISNMLIGAENQVGYQHVNVNSMVVSSVTASESVTTEHQGELLLCTKGVELESGEVLVNYPGKIPAEPLSKRDWEKREFSFINFSVPELVESKPLPQQRMDLMIQQLIGDKLL